MNKDLPGLREWLPWDFKACLLKGRSNYVSLRRWRRYLAEPCKDAEELQVQAQGAGLAAHDRERRPLGAAPARPRGGAVGAASRPTRSTASAIHCTNEDCYVHRARAEAEAADLVVVNHALLLADAEVGGGLLPEFDHLVVDEAHHLEEAATQGLRQEVDGPGLEALLDRLATRPAGTASATGLAGRASRDSRTSARRSSDFAEARSRWRRPRAQRVHELFAARRPMGRRRGWARPSAGRSRSASRRQLREDADWAVVELAARERGHRAGGAGARRCDAAGRRRARLAWRRRARPGRPRARDHPRPSRRPRCADRRGADRAATRTASTGSR